jgi:hypothetical protein
MMGENIQRAGERCWFKFWAAVDCNVLGLRKSKNVTRAIKASALMKLHTKWASVMEQVVQGPTKKTVFWWNQVTCGMVDQMHWKSGHLHTQMGCLTIVWLCQNLWQYCQLYLDECKHLNLSTDKSYMKSLENTIRAFYAKNNTECVFNGAKLHTILIEQLHHFSYFVASTTRFICKFTLSVWYINCTYKDDLRMAQMCRNMSS